MQFQNIYATAQLHLILCYIWVHATGELHPPSHRMHLAPQSQPASQLPISNHMDLQHRLPVSHHTKGICIRAILISGYPPLDIACKTCQGMLCVLSHVGQLLHSKPHECQNHTSDILACCVPVQFLLCCLLLEDGFCDISAVLLTAVLPAPASAAVPWHTHVACIDLVADPRHSGHRGLRMHFRHVPLPRSVAIQGYGSTTGSLHSHVTGLPQDLN